MKDLRRKRRLPSAQQLGDALSRLIERSQRVTIEQAEVKAGYTSGKPAVVLAREDSAEATGRTLPVLNPSGLTLAATDRLVRFKDRKTGVEIVAKAGTPSAPATPVLSVNTATVGTVGSGEDDLHTYSLPAGKLAASGDHLTIEAWGIFADVTNNKQLKLHFGSTVLYNSGPTAAQNIAWNLEAIIIRTGASTQEGIVKFRSDNTTIIDKVYIVSANQNLASSVTIKCTGERVSGLGDNVITQEGSIIKFFAA